LPPTPRIVLFANTDWYLYNFRLPLAKFMQAHLGAEVWAICPDGPHRSKLEAEGLHWIPVQVDRHGLNPLKDLQTAFQLARELRRIRPDLLHNFTLKAILAGTLAARIADVPRVVNAVTGLGSMFTPGTQSYGLPRKLLTAFFRWTFRVPGIRTIFQHQGDLDQLAPSMRQQVRCRLIAGSGVDPIHFFPSGHPPVQPVFLLTSRLLKDKGIREFCEASVIVRRTHPEAVFQVAGSIDAGNPGSYNDLELEELKAHYPGVEFLGHRADMPALYRQASVAVLPSRYGEGVPRSLIEAAFSGLPLVAVDGGGIRAIVQQGKTGLLVPAGDSPALAQALLDLLADPATRHRFGQAGRALAMEMFSQQMVLDATMAVYDELGFPVVPAPQGRMCVNS
jgi:glycosyltransferase involved in cell wall biosynthesis